MWIALGWMAGANVLSGAEADTLFRQTSELLKLHCLDCHSTARHKGDLDLERFGSVEAVRREPKVWEALIEQVGSGEMPPSDEKQPTAAERETLLAGARELLEVLALEQAGDPGPVLLRRLSNAEYTYTVRDLTGVESLDPAREFPVDGAAGEGFVNTGQSLVMSPTLFTKYLDAAKSISQHLVLVPDGLRFSAKTTRRDQTEELLGKIRQFHGRYTDSGGSDRVNLQGIIFETNEGGRLPVERYLTALLEDREGLARGEHTLDDCAKRRGLSPVYLRGMHTMLEGREPSLLLDGLRRAWREGRVSDVASMTGFIAAWQKAVWKFNSVGHIGKVGGPKAWMESVDPVGDREDFRVKPVADAEGVVRMWLVAGDAGDGAVGDRVAWRRPRLTMPGKPEVSLKDFRGWMQALEGRRGRVKSGMERLLEAVLEVERSGTAEAVTEAARTHEVDAGDLRALLDHLGLAVGTTARLEGHFTGQLRKLGGHDFVNGWGSPETPSLIANASEMDVRVPGDLKARSVAIHPSPTRQVLVAWRSPVTGMMTVEGTVRHAHPECGNGVTWTVEMRRGNQRTRLASGVAQGARVVPFGPIEGNAMREGDVVALVVGPRDGNHSCDTTAVELRLRSAEGKAWDLGREISGDVLAGNPHADGQGNAEVWHFCQEPLEGQEGTTTPIPPGSLLARWKGEKDPERQRALAVELGELLRRAESEVAEGPDRVLHAQLLGWSGPLLAGARERIQPLTSDGAGTGGWGMPAAAFGGAPGDVGVGTEDLVMDAPAMMEIRLPGGLVDGYEWMVSGGLVESAGKQGSVQLRVATGEKPAMEAGPWPASRLVTRDGTEARARVMAGLSEFRELFPGALCYQKIVPVDEVVTLTLFHREDEALGRLMLGEEERRELDRLWDELRFVSEDALTLVDAFEQLWQYATQDADPSAFEPMRQPILDRAKRFREWQREVEPRQLEAVLGFAGRAFRRPLSERERGELAGLYRKLREEELTHGDALRFVATRVLVSPAFLYRMETPVAGKAAGPLGPWELANRLSYFLWSSAPDQALSQAAATGRLMESGGVEEQVRRMLRDGRVRRMAEEFGCAWLQVHGFDRMDEKSERHFPGFVSVRGHMYEETLRFLTDFLMEDGPVTGLLDADHTFLNGAMAEHYGIPGISGPEWRRVSGVKAHGRGGVLGLATVLAQQSGASRTSPVLRGNWLCEVLLGEKLPRPPKDVPQLPEEEGGNDGRTMRELVERHSSDLRCAGCHRRIDPYGFALEAYDAIGRRREVDLGGQPVRTRVKVPDGTEIEGMDGLREHLLGGRREAFLRQFCRKLLGYSLGRSVQLSDGPLLKEMEQALAADGYRVSAAILMVTGSRQFREIRGRDADR